MAGSEGRKQVKKKYEVELEDKERIEEIEKKERKPLEEIEKEHHDH